MLCEKKPAAATGAAPLPPRANVVERAAFWTGTAALLYGRRWTLRALALAIAARYLTSERSMAKSSPKLKGAVEFVAALAAVRALFRSA